jgi:F0F1-type ATP synthase assembly protein I
MKKSLEEATRTKAHALVRRITAAHHLDPAIDEELYDHLEDKLLAYLNGEEPITEDDALILVERHFGDENELTALLANVHEDAVTLSLGRKIAAACIITLAAAWACGMLAIPLQGAAIRLAGGAATDAGRGLAFYLFHAAAPLYPLGAAAAFAYWRKRQEPEHRPWIYRWTVRDFIRAGLLLVVGIAITPGFQPSQLYTFLPALAPFRPSPTEAAIASGVIQCWLCIAWLWWCGVTTRQPRTIAMGLGAWMALHLALQSIPVQILLLPSDAGAIAATHAFGIDWSWAIRLTPLRAVFALMPAKLADALFYAVGSLLVYLLVTKQVWRAAQTEYEFKRIPRKLHIIALGVTITSNYALVLQDTEWTVSVAVVGTISAVLAAVSARLLWVDVPRAATTRALYRFRALQYASSSAFLIAMVLPITLRGPAVITESPAKAAMVALMTAAVLGMAAAAWVNWRKRNQAIDEEELATGNGSFIK